jgi:hypothetical protein
MTIATLKLDSPTKLSFAVAITGASGIPEARFIIEDKAFSISYPCIQTNEGVEVEIGGLKDILKAGDYQARLEIVLENKLYVPLRDVITFEPTVEIAAAKPTKEVKESVVMGKVTVKITEPVKAPINETFLRKTQAAMIIAQSLKYTPEQNESAQETIDSAIRNSGSMSENQLKTLQEMLKLAESVGVDVSNIALPVLTEAKVPETEEDESEAELEDMVNGVTDWEHIIHAYDDDELVMIDSETGEILDHDLTDDLNESDELNEVLSRAERIKAKIRFARTANKRQRATRIALKRHSSNATINTRARRLAINIMKTKLARGKPLAGISVPEKMRIEKIIEQRSKLVGRLALKLTSRIRNIEKSRLAHKAVTQ